MAIGTTLRQYGWDDPLSLGYTSATVGLFSGIIGGMVLINIATRRGWTRLVRTAQQLPADLRTGFVPPDKRSSMGEGTVNPISLDPFTWHFALVLTACGLAYFINDALKSLLPGRYEVPTFALAMLMGVALQKLLNGVRLGSYVDRRVIKRIGSWITDYLVAFGVASIKIAVVMKYVLPTSLLFAFGVAFSVWLTLYLGKRMFHNFWFERSIFVYGWLTGVVATSVTLLRIVDPKFKKKALEDYGLAYIFISFFEIVIISVLPTLIARGIVLIPALVLCGGFFACLVLSRWIIGWFPKSSSRLREGEAEIIRDL